MVWKYLLPITNHSSIKINLIWTSKSFFIIFINIGNYFKFTFYYSTATYSRDNWNCCTAVIVNYITLRKYDSTSNPSICFDVGLGCTICNKIYWMSYINAQILNTVLVKQSIKTIKALPLSAWIPCRQTNTKRKTVSNAILLWRSWNKLYIFFHKKQITD